MRFGARLIRLRACLSAALAVAFVALSSAVVATAATLRVTTKADSYALHSGRCTLREAIAAVDSTGLRTDCGTAGRTANTIVLGSGRYVLSIAPAGSDGDASGDLNITGREPVTILGAGPHATTIDAVGMGDRVIRVAQGSRVTLAQLRITGGSPPGGRAGLGGSDGAACSAGGAGAKGANAGWAGEGGGIFNAGRLELKEVQVVGNRGGAGGSGGGAGSTGCAGGQGGQGGNGGGLYNLGVLTLTDSTVDGNQAGPGGPGGAGAGNPDALSGLGGDGGPGGIGGGIYSRGRVQVTGSTISGNRAGIGGPGGRGAGSSGGDSAGGPGGLGGGVGSATALRLVNDTLVGNLAGSGGPGGGTQGSGGPGGDGGAVAVTGGSSLVRNATIANNGVGDGGPGASTAGVAGARGLAGGLFVVSLAVRPAMVLQNTIVASSSGAGCVATPRWGIANGGHDLSFGDGTCPGKRGDPRLEPLRSYGGPTMTMALRAGSAAIGQVPRHGGHCPAADQRDVHRPQGKGCDIGAYEFAVPKITLAAPFPGGSYDRGSPVRVRFRCGEGGIASPIASCRGTVAAGHRIPTGRLGRLRFVVSAVDRSGNRVRRTVHYSVWEYVNPLSMVSGLTPRRIDLGVDYAGSGPLLAIGRGQVTTASDTDDGPESCWAISCWPGGGIVVYRLLDGPFAGKYVYVAEHLTVTVRVGQTVQAGQRIATLYAGYPWSEWGWAAGPGPEALAMADGHRCTCSDPGGWSTIEGRNMNDLLVRLGAPSGYLQSTVPDQSMPRGWPSWSR